MIRNTGRACAGKAAPDWNLALSLRDKYNRVRLGYSNLLTFIETDPSFERTNNTETKSRWQSCAEAVDAKLKVRWEVFAHDLVLLDFERVKEIYKSDFGKRCQGVRARKPPIRNTNTTMKVA